MENSDKEVEELLPCPFCGGAGNVDSETVFCQKCGCMTCQGITVKRSIEYWNTRQPEREQDAPCYLCQRMTNSLAADPMQWNVRLPYPGGEGNIWDFHFGCVYERMFGKPEQKLEQI